MKKLPGSIRMCRILHLASILGKDDFLDYMYNRGVIYMITMIKKMAAVFTVFMTLCVAGIAQAEEATTTQPTTTTTATAAKVNINTADAATIAGKVKGIGLKRAEAIVAYRTQNGNYKTMEDLAKVKGIGDAFVKVHADALSQAFTLS